MKIKCIGCEVFARAIYLCAAKSPHIVDVELLRRGLHNNSADLRAKLQQAIDGVGADYGAVALAYGLCGKAAEGLKAGAVPLIVPRAHDCIAIFLGSRARYQEEFTKCPGTYWYAQDYIERDDGSGGTLALGAADMDMKATREEYVAKYGEDNADYLMEVMGAWQAHYNRAAFIDMGVGDGSAVAAKAQSEAARHGWTFERMAGDMVLIRKMLNGDWDCDFLVVQPGQQIKMTYDENVISCG